MGSDTIIIHLSLRIDTATIRGAQTLVAQTPVMKIQLRD